MKSAVGTFLTAGIATASAAAVALAPISPLNTASDEVVVIPAASVQTQQRDVALTGVVEDFLKHVEWYWEGVSEAPERTWESAQAVGNLLEGAFETAPATTVTYAVVGAPAIAGRILQQGRIKSVDIKVLKIAADLDGKDRKLEAATLRNTVQTRNNLEDAILTVAERPAADLKQIVNVLEDKSVKWDKKPGEILKQLRVNDRATRQSLFGNDPNGQLGGAFGNVRDAMDNQRAAFQTAVDKELNKTGVGRSLQKNVVKPLRDAADNLRTEVRKAGDSIRKTVRKALGDDKP